jgi:hypothetical protein
MTMAKARKKIPDRTKLAAALLTIVRPNEHGELVPVIDYASARLMTEDQILSIFQWDHYPTPVNQGGKDVHHNLVPRPILEHRTKSARIDKPAFNKSLRLSEAQEETRRKMLAKAGQGWTAPPTDPPKKKPKKSWKPPNCKWDWRQRKWVRLPEKEGVE